MSETIVSPLWVASYLKYIFFTFKINLKIESICYDLIVIFKLFILKMFCSLEIKYIEKIKLQSGILSSFRKYNFLNCNVRQRIILYI